MTSAPASGQGAAGVNSCAESTGAIIQAAKPTGRAGNTDASLSQGRRDAWVLPQIR